MQCNIDRRGRVARLITGILCCIAGIALVANGLIGGIKFGRLLWGAGLLLAGLFQIFEARKGWCVMRAMGVKTPM